MEEELVIFPKKPRSILYECGICSEKQPPSKVIIFECSHYLCRDCLGKIRNDLCPYCRADLSGQLSDKENSRIQRCQREDRDFNPFQNYVIEMDLRTLAAIGLFLENTSGSTIPSREIREIVNRLYNGS